MDDIFESWRQANVSELKSSFGDLWYLAAGTQC